MNIRQTIVASALFLAATVSGGAQASTNLALLTQGASFVSASSVIPQGTFGLTFNYTNMQNNILTNAPVPPTVSNGDIRYIFGLNDPAQNIVIKLGQISSLTSIGANVQVPSYGDRVVSQFAAETSADGVNWANFGSTTFLNGSSVNPITITGAANGVQYVRYDFGPSYNNFGGGGSAVYQVFASSVPEPATWAMLMLGFVGIGYMMRGARRRDAVAAA